MEPSGTSIDSGSLKKIKLLRTNSFKMDEVMVKTKNNCDKYLIHPDSRFKVLWDLIIIILSVYNSLLIPYEFAYDIETSIFLDALDRMIDIAFLFDILINFRTMYRDSHTDEVVKNGK